VTAEHLQTQSIFSTLHLGLGGYPWVVRCLPAPSVGAATGASTCPSPPAPASLSWSSGGGKSGSIASILAAGFAGVSPSGADGLGAGTATIVPALVDSSRVGDLGARVAVAGLSWRSAALAALMKSSQSLYKSKHQNVYCATGGKLTVQTSS
jgi:hypothetical protein